jgi:hypothetical protein
MTSGLPTIQELSGANYALEGRIVATGQELFRRERLDVFGVGTGVYPTVPFGFQYFGKVGESRRAAQQSPRCPAVLSLVSSAWPPLDVLTSLFPLLPGSL